MNFKCRKRQGGFSIRLRIWKLSLGLDYPILSGS